MLKKLFVAIVGLAALSACNNSTSGTLVVNRSFTVNTTSGSPFPGEGNMPAPVKYTINVGSYDADLQVKNAREILLQVKVNGTTDISVDVPEGVKIPETAGEFSIPAAKAGQPFDVMGVVNTRSETGQLRREWESCSYTREEQVCGYDPNGHYHCWLRTVTVHGQREVEYTPVTHTKMLTLNLVEATTTLAAYSGNRVDVERQYSYQGRCF